MHISEEQVREAITNIGEFIDIETQFIRKAHDLEVAVGNIAYITDHVGEFITKDRTRLYDLVSEIIGIFAEIQGLVAEENGRDFRIEREERRILEKLEEDMKHGEWRAVRVDIREEAEAEKKALQVELHEFEALNEHFKRLTELLEESNIAAAVEADAAQELAERITPHFLQIRKLTEMYAEVFETLWKKGKKVYDEVEDI